MCVCIHILGGFPKLGGPFSGGPHNKDYSVLGSIWGFSYIGKISYAYVYDTHFLFLYRCVYMGLSRLV